MTDPAILLLEAHVENLIERVYEVEQVIEALLLGVKSLENRVLALEQPEYR